MSSFCNLMKLQKAKPFLHLWKIWVKMQKMWLFCTSDLELRGNTDCVYSWKESFQQIKKKPTNQLHVQLTIQVN